MKKHSIYVECNICKENTKTWISYTNEHRNTYTMKNVVCNSCEDIKKYLYKKFTFNENNLINLR